jgi:hypothetical protein
MGDSTVVGVSSLYSSHRFTAFDKNAPFKPSFASAVVKLELLRLKLIDPGSVDFTAEDRNVFSASALSDPTKSSAITKGRNILLGWVLCRATGKPDLGGTAIPGITGCHDPDPKELKSIADGFDTLTRFVQTGK